MSDSLQTFDVGKIDALVAETVGQDDKVDVPEEIQTQMAGDMEEPEHDLERDLDVLQRLDPNFINDPVRLYLRATHHLAEGAGAAGLAGLLKLRDRLHGKRVGIILSGANIDEATLRRIVNREL